MPLSNFYNLLLQQEETLFVTCKCFLVDSRHLKSLAYRLLVLPRQHCVASINRLWEQLGKRIWVQRQANSPACLALCWLLCAS